MFKSIIQEEIKKALARLNIPETVINIEKPAEERHGDYSCNIAMLLAKKLKKSPIETAKDIVAEFPRPKFIEKIQIEHPGFINFYISKDGLRSMLAAIARQKSSFGVKSSVKKEKIVLEHTSVNPNKALHIGHLRGACLGASLEKIQKSLGYAVESEYYIDDTGVQVAVSALGIKEIGLEKKPGEKYDHYAGRAYV